MAKELFYYTANWCNPCQTLGPIMDEIRRQIPVHKQNVDYIDPAILVENGQELRRFTGVKSYNQIIDWLNYGN